MTTEPDKDVEAVRGALGVLEFRRTRQDALDVLARIEVRLLTAESQNQALQEEKDRWEARAKRPTAVAIADLDERIAALQERAEKAEAALREIVEQRDHYRVRVGEEVEAGLREMGILRDERDALQERAEKAEQERDEALRYIGRPRNAPSYTALQEAVRWVLEDAQYKAPEQIGDVASRWVTRLADALSPTQETDPDG